LRHPLRCTDAIGPLTVLNNNMFRDAFKVGEYNDTLFWTPCSDVPCFLDRSSLIPLRPGLHTLLFPRWSRQGSRSSISRATRTPSYPSPALSIGSTNTGRTTGWLSSAAGVLGSPSARTFPACCGSWTLWHWWPSEERVIWFLLTSQPKPRRSSTSFLIEQHGNTQTTTCRLSSDMTLLLVKPDISFHHHNSIGNPSFSFFKQILWNIALWMFRKSLVLLAWGGKFWGSLVWAQFILFHMFIWSGGFVAGVVVSGMWTVFEVYLGLFFGDEIRSEGAFMQILQDFLLFVSCLSFSFLNEPMSYELYHISLRRMTSPPQITYFSIFFFAGWKVHSVSNLVSASSLSLFNLCFVFAWFLNRSFSSLAAALRWSVLGRVTSP
jgi:hypothetical protein